MNADVPVAANANLTGGPRAEAVLRRSRGGSLLGLAELPPERTVSTLGKHQIKCQTLGSEFPLEVSSMKKMSALCLVVSCHLIPRTLTGVCPVLPFYSSV